MQRRSSASWIVSVALGIVVGAGIGCGAPEAKQPAPLPTSDQVGFNPITKVSPGMTLLDVMRQIQTPPRDVKGNTYYYKGWGRVVFEGTHVPTDRTKVVKVEPDKMEDGIAP